MKIRLKRKLLKAVRCFRRKRDASKNFQRPSSSSCYGSKAISRVCVWASSMKFKAKQLCSSNSGYKRLGSDDDRPKIPKGHLAVYVGESDKDTRRVLVPVIYFNHPLFGELLKEAERVIGYDHRGGIQIPCPVSEFENVKTRIAAYESGRSRRRSNRVF